MIYVHTDQSFVGNAIHMVIHWLRSVTFEVAFCHDGTSKLEMAS